MSTPFKVPDPIDWGEKQIWERPQYSLNCKPYMAAGETINWFGVVIYESGTDPEVTPLTSLLYSVSWTTTKVAFRPQLGTSGKTYLARLRWTTDQGGQYEIEGKYTIKEEV